MPFFIPRKRKVSVSATWSRIEKWLAKHFPAALMSLNRGATTKQISQLEKSTRRVLPDDLKESLQVHNGQSDVVEGVIFGLRLLPVKDIQVAWEGVRVDPQDGAASARAVSLPKDAVQLCENHPGWIPVTCDGSGGHFGVDLAHGLSGTWGQVINFGVSEFNHVASSQSWGDFLADFMDELNAGNFVLTDNEDGSTEFCMSEENLHFSDHLPALYKKRKRKSR